jgi:hypothetical protein
MRRGLRFAGDLQELIENFGQGRVEVFVVGLLQKGQLDRAGDGPEDVVGFAVIDYEAEHGPGIGGAVLLIGAGGAVGGEKAELEDEVGVGGIGERREIAGGFEGGVELGICAIGISAEWLGKQATVGAGVRDKDGLGDDELARDWASLIVGGHLRKSGGR